MKDQHLKLSLSTSLLVLGALSACAATEEKIAKRFSVQPGQNLVVDVGFGTIDVRTNGTREVVIDVWRKVRRKNKAAEDAFLKAHPVEFSQTAVTVTIHSPGNTGSGSSWSLFRRNDSSEAKYTITVPSQFNANLKTGGGDVNVSDITGNVEGNTGGGGLSFARLHGSLDGNTGGGGIDTEDCQGPINLDTGGGGVQVSLGSGSLHATTGGGSVTVRTFRGSAEIRSGGGGLTLENVTGAIAGSTGGGGIDAVLPSEVSEPVNLSTGGGGITLRAPGAAAFQLDARTDGGGVSSELPVVITGKMKGGCLQGPVNGGGKAVTLRTGGGGIHIRKL